MTMIYGHKWTSIATSDDGTWLDGLHGLTVDNIKTGFKRILESGDKFPPSLPEFRYLCLDIDSDMIESNAVMMVKADMPSFDYQRLTYFDHEQLLKKYRPKAETELVKQSINSNLKRLSHE